MPSATSRCGRASKPIHVAQHRLREKEFFRQLGIGTADYQPIRSEADIAAATALPGILKTCTEGYDGKGQVRVADRAALAAAWRRLGGATASWKRWSTSLRDLGHRGARPGWRDALLSRSA